jgi:hypothetical protein
MMDPTVSVLQTWCRFLRKYAETSAVIKQAFREESMGHVQVFEWKIPN